VPKSLQSNQENLFIIARHAESTLNAGIWSPDRKTPSITEIGLEQAQKLSTKLFNTYPIPEDGCIITSNFRRTMETAQPFADLTGIKPIVWETIHEYYAIGNEIGKSKIDPLLRCEEQNAERSRFVYEKCDPFYKDSPDAEPFCEFVDRTIDSVIKLSELKGSNFIFTHGYFIRLLLLLLESDNWDRYCLNTTVNYNTIMREYGNSIIEGSKKTLGNCESLDITDQINKVRRYL
jgi:broad specificity phosphatase PhoE